VLAMRAGGDLEASLEDVQILGELVCEVVQNRRWGRGISGAACASAIARLVAARKSVHSLFST